MSRINVKDNSRIAKEELSKVSHLVDKVADKTLEQLAKEGIFVFPELIQEFDDLTKDQMILQSVNNHYLTSNVMGFLGLGSEILTIESRFDGDGQNFLFHYLLERILDVPNLVNLDTDSNQNDRIFRLLLFMFPQFLKQAMRKGVFKTYIRKKYNDSNVKGTIDVARHIVKNTPFTGNIAYSQREYSCDNDVMELVRHTIEYIRNKRYGYRLLSQVRDEVAVCIASTPSYETCNRQKIIEANKSNVVQHAYYREYRELQHLCLFILQHEKHQVGIGTRQIYGLLFDGAWLWEEYMNLLLGDFFYHPMNKSGHDAQRLFNYNRGMIYPDFISKNSEHRVIADAKYKPVDHIGNKDYLQVLAYMFRFDAKIGFYLYPEAGDKELTVFKLNKGTTYEKNVLPREDIRVLKHGLKIPYGVSDYNTFKNEMKCREREFVSIFADKMN